MSVMLDSVLGLSNAELEFVMAGLDPAIHEAVHQSQTYGLQAEQLIMDCRVKPGNDPWRGWDHV
jgi:hypothetical protein